MLPVECNPVTANALNPLRRLSKLDIMAGISIPGRVKMLDLTKLAKVLALADSSNAGEASAAIESARRILARDGKGFADLATLLIKGQGQSTPSGMASHVPESKPPAPTDTTPPPSSPTDAQRIHSLLARYGSRDAVLAPCSREKLLRLAVGRWARQESPPHERWTASLDGWTAETPPRHMPADIRRAVEGAYSLPTSVTGAIAELEYWEKRDGEIALLRPAASRRTERPGASQLDLPALARATVIRRLVEHGLRARTVADALARVEYWRRRAGRGSWIEAAILEDLRHLADQERSTTDGEVIEKPPTHFRTASERREEVIRLLSERSSAALSDREIARRVGVSPQTVGNLRRRLTV